MTWNEILKEEKEKAYYKELIAFIDKEYDKKIIYPKKENIFNAFKYTEYEDVKVVILGQDPYHEMNQAEGLSFSVPDGVKLPPSLVNIFKELKDDLGVDQPNSGSLVKWAKQGVLLLNAVLTVEENKAASHRNMGWEIFTDKVIELVNKKEEPVVFILWGNFARSKKKLITNSKHLIIESNHPSPLSAYRGFFGSKPFSKTNKFLEKNNIKTIKW